MYFESEAVPPIRVLVVDDDPVSRLLTERHLRSAGAVTRSADDGADALKKLHAEPADVAIIDRFMPQLGGLELCRQIRADASLAGTHVIMISSLDDPAEVLEAFAAGVDDFLAKPCVRGQLLARLEVATRQTRMRRTLIDQVRRTSRLNEQLTDLNAQLRLISSMDDLTGILNRRGTIEHLESYHDTARRYGVPLSLAMIDLDGFKLVNDHEGHPAGDAVLRQFAFLLSEQFRASDIVGRLGGDEFLVILPHTTAEQAVQTAERCREAFASDPLSHRPDGVRLTMSTGVLEVPPGETTVSQLLIDVDAAAYAAKRQGKNRVRSGVATAAA